MFLDSAKDSLAAKLLTIVFAYYLVVTTVVTLSHMGAEFLFEKDNVTSDLSIFHGTFEPGLAIALWNQEDLAMQSSLEAMIQVPQIVGAKVLDDEGIMVGAIGQIVNQEGNYISVNGNGDIETLTQSDSGSGLFWGQSDINFTDEQTYLVGSLTLYSNSGFVFGRVQLGYLFIIINAVIKTIALWLLVLWQSKPIISEPLSKLRSAIGSRNHENLKDFNLDLKHSGNRELEELEDAFNSMTSNLSQTMQDLQRTNEELEKFAYVASHDLKSPLRAIDSLSEMLEEDLGDDLEEESKEHLEQLRGRVTRMNYLLDSLLEYSRAGHHTNNTSFINAGELVNDVANLLNVPSGFTVKVDDSLREIEVPRMPLEQIFHNLINNALKHHDQESGTVTISARLDGDYLEFTVSDDGPGIPEQFQKKVFEMFQTLKPRDEVEGSGMGLALVKKILYNFGANLRLNSTEGNGAEFIFTWPQNPTLLSNDVIID